jgi:hypothetical protein
MKKKLDKQRQDILVVLNRSKQCHFTAQKTTESNLVISMLCAWDIRPTPNNIIDSFRRSGIVVEWNQGRSCLMAAVVREEGRRNASELLSTMN